MVVAVSVGLHFSAVHSSSRAWEKTICSAPFLRVSSGFSATKPFRILSRGRSSSSGTTIIPRAAPVTDVEDGNQGETDTIPTPIVIIDQDSDPEATVVEITFGDRLGALLDTVMKEVSPQQTLWKKFIKKASSGNLKTGMGQVLVLATAIAQLINSRSNRQPRRKETYLEPQEN